MTLPEQPVSGFYTINTVRLYDNALEILNYDPAAHGGLAGFEFVNPLSDGDAPVLGCISVLGFFDPATGRPTLHYDIQWSDGGSGLANSYLRVYLPGGGQNDRWLTVENGRSVGTMLLVSASPEGIYLALTLCHRCGWKSEYVVLVRGLGPSWISGSINVFAPSEQDYAGAVVQGNETSSILFGGNLDDVLLAGSGDDQLLSGAGDGILSSGDGNDIVDAGAGDDLIVGGSGAWDDVYRGGAGKDIVRYTSAVSGIEVNLTAGTATGAEIGNDALAAIENVIGGQGDDEIIGDELDNLLDGRAGHDIIRGEKGMC